MKWIIRILFGQNSDLSMGWKWLLGEQDWAWAALLYWFASFFQGRFQLVMIGKERSHLQPLLLYVGCRMVRPTLRSYSIPIWGCWAISSIPIEWGIVSILIIYIYQFYISFLNDLSDAVNLLPWCLEAVRVWMGRTGFNWALEMTE